MKVLVVENDNGLREEVCDALRSEGFPAEGVSDYERAAPLLRTSAYRVAVIAPEHAATVRRRYRTPVVTMSRDVRVVLDRICELLHARAARGG